MTPHTLGAMFVKPSWTVVDLFSGGGGASYGFHAAEGFELLAAADFEVAKPSTGMGKLECNDTYEANIGVRPLHVDLGVIQPPELRDRLGLSDSPTVLVACPPCTGFSRTNASNHLRDDPRNSLVGRVGLFVDEFKPSVLVLENARELLMGRYRHHYLGLRQHLEAQGYEVHASLHYLSQFGLPQLRERALVVAALKPLKVRSLEDLWEGYAVDPKATHVRRAIWDLPSIEAGEAHPDDDMHVAPRMGRLNTERLAAIPHDGGSWRDLVDLPDADKLLTDGMKRQVAKRDFGSFPDVYGRLAWDKPAATIKRECSHVGNGRYSHPDQDRLCSVREMAILQGFPRDYRFDAGLGNMYRHIGDAVPPLISYQLSRLAEWILTGKRPDIESVILPGTHLSPGDIVSAAEASSLPSLF